VLGEDFSVQPKHDKPDVAQDEFVPAVLRAPLSRCNQPALLCQ